MSVVVLRRRRMPRSACFAHFFSVWPMQPVLLAIDRIVEKRGGYCASWSSGIRRKPVRRFARHRSSLLVSIRKVLVSLESVVIRCCRCRFARAALWTNENRARYDRSKLRYLSDLTDAEWALIAPLPPTYAAARSPC